MCVTAYGVFACNKCSFGTHHSLDKHTQISADDHMIPPSRSLILVSHPPASEASDAPPPDQKGSEFTRCGRIPILMLVNCNQNTGGLNTLLRSVLSISHCAAVAAVL